ncbi:MAG: hypothetical protein HS109_01535 [Burkholderiales bacterium]|nr:hypothetical protein [Burkholderiales bacterium]
MRPRSSRPVAAGTGWQKAIEVAADARSRTEESPARCPTATTTAVSAAPPIGIAETIARTPIRSSVSRRHLRRVDAEASAHHAVNDLLLAMRRAARSTRIERSSTPSACAWLTARRRSAVGTNFSAAPAGPMRRRAD